MVGCLLSSNTFIVLLHKVHNDLVFFCCSTCHLCLGVLNAFNIDKNLLMFSISSWDHFPGVTFFKMYASFLAPGISWINSSCKIACFGSNAITSMRIFTCAVWYTVTCITHAKCSAQEPFYTTPKWCIGEEQNVEVNHWMHMSKPCCPQMRLKPNMRVLRVWSSLGVIWVY